MLCSEEPNLSKANYFGRSCTNRERLKNQVANSNASSKLPLKRSFFYKAEGSHNGDGSCTAFNGGASASACRPTNKDA